MRVLHVLRYAEMGGIENYTRNLFPELERRGHANVIVQAGELLEAGCDGRRVYHIPELVQYSDRVEPTVERTLARVLVESPADVAFVHTAMNAAAWRLLLRSLPIVYFAHNYSTFCPAGTLYYRRGHRNCEFDTAPALGCLANAYLQGCNTRRPMRLLDTYQTARQTKDWVLQADRIVCDSTYVKERHVRAGFNETLVEVLPSPVGIPDHVPPQPCSRDTVLFCGRLVPNKGLRTLVAALRLLPPTLRLVIAGDGPMRDELELLALSDGLRGRIELVGRRAESELGELYTRAFAVAVPSEWPEPLGMVGPEAMGHARPVVGTAAGGSAEWLKDGVTGIVVPPAAPVPLASAIERLACDVELATRLGTAGRRLVEERFLMAAHVDRLLDVLAAAGERHRQRTGAGVVPGRP